MTREEARRFGEEDMSCARREFDMVDPQMDLPRRSVRSGAAVMVGQATMFVLGIVSVAVLGRLLSPNDFGLLAMAAAFLALITNFADLGLQQATIQRSEITEAQINVLFWVNAVVGLTAALIGIAVAYPISWFYKEPALVSVTAILSVGFFVTGISVQHQAILRRRMRFWAESAISVSAMAGAIVLAVLAAVLGAGYWALVVLALATTVFRSMGMWIACDWRPARPRCAAGVGSLLRFGAFLTGTQVMGTIVRNLDRALIGRVFGPGDAGYYANACRLLLMPVGQLNMPLTSVAIPTLSRLQHEPERFRAFYQRGLETIAAVALPTILICVIAADHLIPTVLGEQWDRAIPIFKALSPRRVAGLSKRRNKLGIHTFGADRPTVPLASVPIVLRRRVLFHRPAVGGAGCCVVVQHRHLPVARSGRAILPARDVSAPE